MKPNLSAACSTLSFDGVRPTCSSSRTRVTGHTIRSNGQPVLPHRAKQTTHRTERRAQLAFAQL